MKPLMISRTGQPLLVLPRLKPADLIATLHFYLLSLIYSQSFLWAPQLRSPANYAAFSTCLIFFGVSFYTNRRAFVATLIMIAIVVGYMFVFSSNFDTPVTGEMLGSYPGLFSVGIFGYYASRKDGLARVLSLLYIASILYALTFLYAHFHVDADAIMRTQKKGKAAEAAVFLAHGSVAGSADVRYRIAISVTHLAIGFLFSLELWRATRSRLSLAMLALFAFCIVSCDFRYFQVAIVVATLVALAPAPIAFRATVLAIFNAVVQLLFVLSGLFSYNIFAVTTSDSTGAVRYYENEYALRLIHEYPLLGIGLFSHFEDTQRVYGFFKMAPSDIGYYGILLQYGLIGMIGLIACNYFLYLFVRRLPWRPDVARPHAALLLSIFAFLAIEEIPTTILWEEGGTLFLALMIGFWSTGPYRTAALRPDRTVPAPGRGRYGLPVSAGRSLPGG